MTVKYDATTLKASIHAVSGLETIEWGVTLWAEADSQATGHGANPGSRWEGRPNCRAKGSFPCARTTLSGLAVFLNRFLFPETSLWDNLAVNARRYPDKRVRWCFGAGSAIASWPKAQRLAAQLSALGVQRGDRVVLCMQNCPQLVMAHFAILRANAVVVPVSPHEPRRGTQALHYRPAGAHCHHYG